ncbi:MAG: hypothetical protein K6T29_06085 [Peptococcaceae bacterium]|nr:hypothetical protein [Peptococcaceae bacterium]
MSFFENLFHGNLTIHQDFINKLIKEAIAENKVVKNVEISISGGFINLTAQFNPGGDLNIDLKAVLSLGKFEFNRSNRFLELPVHGPLLVSIQGVYIKARLSAELDPDPARRSGTPAGLVSLLQYLDLKEDKITLDFNKMPGFNRVLQNKAGFLLKHLEITRLELSEGMLLIHPAVKIF